MSRGHNLQPSGANEKCVHCARTLEKKTKDHVFPRSWYPDTTPSSTQRWTVPSCGECNGQSGQREKELFVRLALCVDPRKIEVAGLSERAVRSFGIDVAGISEHELRVRQALKGKILSEVRPHVPGDPTFPGLGPHPGFPVNKQLEIPFPEQLIKEVSRKIVRGCEYILGEERIVEPPYKLEVYFAHEESVADVVKLFEGVGPATIGPGFCVQRAPAHEDPLTVMYRIKVWGTWIIYASILKDD